MLLCVLAWAEAETGIKTIKVCTTEEDEHEE